ncbi:MAG: hypothetical protein H7Y39_02720 [Nitrospiraceae bacterium]|nr:hypothetical protein [Nitrospiraceae bacterium]
MIADSRGIFLWQFPRRIEDLRRQGVLSPVNIGREIIWARYLLIRQASQINAFLNCARDFETELTTGDYRLCIGHLDNIEKEFGFSLWTIENRIAVVQLIDGIEKQKAYMASIRDSRSRNDLVSYIAFQISHRNEENATVGHFAEQVSMALDSVKAHPEIRTYVLFRAAHKMPQTEDDVAILLRYEQNSSNLDYYDTFIRLATWAVVEGSESPKNGFISQLAVLYDPPPILQTPL